MRLPARSHHVEGPGSRLGLVARLVIDLGRHQVLSLDQALLRGVSKALHPVILWGDRLTVHGQRVAQRLDARAGLGIGERGGDGEPWRVEH